MPRRCCGIRGDEGIAPYGRYIEVLPQDGGLFLELEVGEGEGGADGAALQVHVEVGDQVDVLAVVEGIQDGAGGRIGADFKGEGDGTGEDGAASLQWGWVSEI